MLCLLALLNGAWKYEFFIIDFPGSLNLNSLPAHDFSKLSLIEAYNTYLSFDMICLSETYLHFSYADDDPRLT